MSRPAMTGPQLRAFAQIVRGLAPARDELGDLVDVDAKWLGKRWHFNAEFDRAHMRGVLDGSAVIATTVREVTRTR